jgi:polar amino acid transport system substrate-binding protein
MRRSKFCLLALPALFPEWSLGQLVQTGSFPKLTFMTEEWAPFNYKENGTAKGISVEILEYMLGRVNSSQGRADIEFFPWARAYLSAQRAPNTMLFSITRTPERENLFRWVGPFTSMQINVYGLKSKNIKINDVADFKKYRIGTMLEDSSETLFLQISGMSLAEVHRSPTRLQNIKMLQAEHIDLYPISQVSMVNLCKANDINPNTFEKVYNLSTYSLNFALQKDTSEAIVKSLQSALDKLVQEGIVAKILHDYGYEP